MVRTALWQKLSPQPLFKLFPGVLTLSWTPLLDDSSCWSFEHVVSCPASERRDKLQSNGGLKHLQILPQLDPLPSELSSWHLTARAANRPLERHWHSFCVAQDWIGYCHCQFCNIQLFIWIWVSFPGTNSKSSIKKFRNLRKIWDAIIAVTTEGNN